MKNKVKCPVCQSDYVKKITDTTSHCSNVDCVLWYHDHIIFKDVMDNIYRRIRYSSLRDIYYWWRNFLFKRYDIIRCGTGVGNWCDKDYLLFKGSQRLLFDYVEKECGIYFIDDFSGNPIIAEFDESQNKSTQDVLKLYIDWKVTYPMLVKDESNALDDWSESTNMVFGINPEFPNSKFNSVTFSSNDGYTNEERKVLFDYHSECENIVAEFEQDLLHRLVDVRSVLWT